MACFELNFSIKGMVGAPWVWWRYWCCVRCRDSAQAVGFSLTNSTFWFHDYWFVAIQFPFHSLKHPWKKNRFHDDPRPPDHPFGPLPFSHWYRRGAWAYRRVHWGKRTSESEPPDAQRSGWLAEVLTSEGSYTNRMTNRNCIHCIL